jgi:hypothetical protein
MKYLIAIIVIIMSFQAFIYWPVRTSPAGAKYEWKSQEEKKEFQWLLKKHGQHKIISVIFRDDRGREYYFNEKGQKCLFI